MGRFQNNFTEMFLEWPSTEFAKMVPLRWTKWPSKLKIEKPFKQHLLLGQWADFKIIFQECSLDDPLPKLLKMVLLCWTKWPPELKIEKTRKTTSSPRPVGRFQNNFTEMFLGWPSTKIAKMVPLRWTKWPTKLKIEKPFKRHLLPGQWADFKIISQKCTWDDPLLKLLKWFRSAEQNGRQS